MDKNSVTFLDGRTFSIGQRVSFDTKYGSSGTGTVTGFGRTLGATTIKIEPDSDTVHGQLDRWPLKKGGEYNRLRDSGIFGGEIA